jgi:hypothetical protein
MLFDMLTFNSPVTSRHLPVWLHLFHVNKSYIPRANIEILMTARTSTLLFLKLDQFTCTCRLHVTSHIAIEL